MRRIPGLLQRMVSRRQGTAIHLCPTKRLSAKRNHLSLCHAMLLHELHPRRLFPRAHLRHEQRTLPEPVGLLLQPLRPEQMSSSRHLPARRRRLPKRLGLLLPPLSRPGRGQEPMRPSAWLPGPGGNLHFGPKLLQWKLPTDATRTQPLHGSPTPDLQGHCRSLLNRQRMLFRRLPRQ